MLKSKKLSTIITPKSAANNSTSRKAIPMIMVMATLLLVTSASMIAPAKAQLRGDLPITIPDPDDRETKAAIVDILEACLREAGFPNDVDIGAFGLCVIAATEPPLEVDDPDDRETKALAAIVVDSCHRFAPPISCAIAVLQAIDP